MLDNRDINIVIQNAELEGNEDLIPLLFGIDVPIEYIPADFDIYDILVKYGLFKSKGDAKKNWKKSSQEIPEGLNSFERLGKLRLNLHIWKPPILHPELRKILLEKCKFCKVINCDGCPYDFYMIGLDILTE